MCLLEPIYLYSEYSFLRRQHDILNSVSESEPGIESGEALENSTDEIVEEYDNFVRAESSEGK